MTVFADASFLVCLIANEDGATSLTAALATDEVRLYSAMSAWEAATGLCRSYGLSVLGARTDVASFLSATGFQLVAIGTREMQLALDAYAQYGKGHHPAALNMGDCFAYACAKAHNAKLLYKGQDFARTDLA